MRVRTTDPEVLMNRAIPSFVAAVLVAACGVPKEQLDAKALEA